MKKSTFIGFIVGLVLTFMVSSPADADPEPPKYDATGVWEVQLTKGWTDCPGETPYPYIGTYNIIQDGNDFTGYDQSDTDYGTIVGNRYQIFETDETTGIGTQAKTIIWHLNSATIGEGTYARIRVDQDPICTFSFDIFFKKQGVCIPTDARMCLQNGRFSVRVFWEDEHGNTG